MIEDEEQSNPVMFVIIMALALLGIGLMASQTWLFIDWLMPGDAIVMKVMTLSMFDLAALAWTLIDLFHVAPSKNAWHMVKSGMWIDFILATLTTIFYCIIAYILRFNVQINMANLAILMEIAVTFATVFNCVLFVLYGHAVIRKARPRRYSWQTKKAVYSLAQTTVIEADKPRQIGPKKGANKPVEIEETSTNKPELSTNKNPNEPLNISTNKKKSLPRRALPGGKNQTPK